MQISSVDTGSSIGFEAAQEAAKAEARKFLAEPMILSWKNQRTGRHSPDVSCCGHDGKEAWEVYAEARGGKLRVEIGGDYVFIFGEGNISR